MSSEKRITFKSFEQTAYRRKNIAILRSIYPEIQSYIASGCTWEDIYEALKSEPYNLDMTLGSLHNAIYRIRADLKKKPENRLSSEKGVNVSSKASISPVQNSGGNTLPKGASVFKTLTQDAKKYDRNPNPNLEDLLKGNNDD